MRVLVCPADLGGCGHYRCIWPAEALAADGDDVTVAPFGATPFKITWVGDAARDEWVDGKPPLGRVQVHSVEHPGYDVVVLQRPLRWELCALIPHFQAHGVRVVVEVDDDFSCIPSRNAAWEACHPLSNPERNHRWLATACSIADLVTVSTPALAARYGSHGRVRVLRNCVPGRYLDIAGRAEDPFGFVTVGWSGTVANHPGDLEVTRGAVGRALGDAQFAVIGDGHHVRGALDLPDMPVASGWLPIADYPHQVAQLDIGIVPLADHAFNRAKSWLKGLEMAALGVPFVASPTPEYQTLHTAGAGLLAAKPKQWEATLRALIADPDRRAALAAEGRDTAGRWTVETNAWRWAEAWADTHEGRVAA